MDSTHQNSQVKLWIFNDFIIKINWIKFTAVLYIISNCTIQMGLIFYECHKTKNEVNLYGVLYGVS